MTRDAIAQDRRQVTRLRARRTESAAQILRH